MQTIRLQVNNDTYKHLMWFLSKFKKEELNIINEDEEFVSIKKYLHNELKNIDNDAVEFVDINQLDAELEATVREYED